MEESVQISWHTAINLVKTPLDTEQQSVVVWKYTTQRLPIEVLNGNQNLGHVPLIKTSPGERLHQSRPGKEPFHTIIF